MIRGRLIGLYSPCPQSGKTSVASTLELGGFRRLSLASPLKSMVRCFLSEMGLRDYEIHHYLEREKEAKIPELGVSARHLMQTLGTQWGRECIDPDVWQRCWAHKVEAYLCAGLSVVCDDVRFVNEAQALRALGGELWFLRRPLLESDQSHESEGALNEYPFFDQHLTNSSSLEALQSQVRNLLKTQHAVTI